MWLSLIDIDEAVDEFARPFPQPKGESQQTMWCHFNLTQAWKINIKAFRIIRLPFEIRYCARYESEKQTGRERGGREKVTYAPCVQGCECGVLKLPVEITLRWDEILHPNKNLLRPDNRRSNVTLWFCIVRVIHQYLHTLFYHRINKNIHQDRWLQHLQKSDPHVCSGWYCAYLWQDSCLRPVVSVHLL